MADNTHNTSSNQPQPTYNESHLRRLEEIVGNVLTSRAELFKELLDPRRDIDDECGYPKGNPPPNVYQELYDREAVSARVVEVLPRESWQVVPVVFEDESSETATPFEEAWDDLANQLRGERSFYKDDKTHPIWEYLRRADELSGIGQFGVILLGIDDGKDLREPIDGVEVDDFVGMGNPSSDRFGTVQAPGVSQVGADAQYFKGSTLMPGGQLPNSSGQLPVSGASSIGTPEPGDATSQDSEDTPEQQDGSIPQKDEGGGSKKGKRKLLFVRVFPESLVQITQYESRPTSPRFGQPVMYLISFNDPNNQQGGVGLPIATMNVHWTRVIHVADIGHQASSSEVFAVPRMRPVLNRLLDLRKLYSGSAEMYWQGAFPGISFETNPQLGGDVDVDIPATRDMWEQYRNGLQRALFLMGMTAKTLSPTVVDPSTQIDVQITAICIKLGIPKRVFMGSERGELASSQDDQAWNDRLRERQSNYITPRIIVPVVDRLIAIGVLPKPTVSKPPPQTDKQFALKKPDPPPMPGAPAVGPDGKPLPGAGGPPGTGGVPAMGGKPPAAGGFPPKAPGAKPPFPSKPSFNRANGKGPTTNAPFPPKKPASGPVPASSIYPPEEDLGDDTGEDVSSIPDSPQGLATDDVGKPVAPVKPEKPSYKIEWPDLTSQSDSEKSTVANTRTTALAAYISGGVDALVPPMEFLTKIMMIDEDTARAIIDAAAKAQEQDDLEKQQQGSLGPDGQPLDQPPGMDGQDEVPNPDDEGIDLETDPNYNPDDGNTPGAPAGLFGR